MKISGVTNADRVIILSALVLVAWLYRHYWGQDSELGESALIFAAGQAQPQRVSLYTPQTLHVKGFLGNSVIEVADGRVRFIASPCQTKQCIHAGWLQHRGDFVTCLPNRISIEVPAPNNQYDSIIY